MAESDRAVKAAVGLSAAAAITAAIALLKKTGVEGGEGELPAIPEELWNLLIAIAQSADNIDLHADKVIAELQKLSINVQGWPPNTEAIQTVRVICTLANQAYQLPDMLIPDGFTLALSAWPLNPAASLILIGEDQSAATNLNRVDALAPGGLRTLAVKNAKTIWISATVAGASACLISEKRR